MGICWRFGLSWFKFFLRVAGRWHLVFEVGWLMGFVRMEEFWMEIGEVLEEDL